MTQGVSRYHRLMYRHSEAFLNMSLRSFSFQCVRISGVSASRLNELFYNAVDMGLGSDPHSLSGVTNSRNWTTIIFT